ncbi:MAG: type II toxin-antitoxin system VapC family toxin [Anaerolineales bacterium]|nr:type II toxin-antitoxin system VapC family toxin [Anaerolineales bacterium]MCB8940055.1 type II toxin-antitoxin system VapC family toxin [Ardenticatenaceae bacterium]
MNVVDSSGWLAYFANDTNAAKFAPIIQATDSLLIPTICMYEVFKRILIQRGEEDALRAVGIMSLGTNIELTQEIAINAAQISTTSKLAMADSIILATARANKATLWTQDADFEGIVGVEYIPK